MSLYDMFIASIALFGWLAFWRIAHSPRRPATVFYVAIVGQIALFATVRTAAILLHFVSAPTVFFSMWGAMIMVQVLIFAMFWDSYGGER